VHVTVSSVYVDPEILKRGGRQHISQSSFIESTYYELYAFCTFSWKYC